MAKQLIVAFTVLVVLTKQSFSSAESSDQKYGQNDVQGQNQYTTTYQQQEASQYSGQSQYQQQYGVGEQSNTNNQGQSTTVNQEQSITNNQEQSITNNQDQSNAYGQNQNKDTTTSGGQGGSLYAYETQHSGSSYGQSQDQQGDAEYQSNGEVSAQEIESETSLQVGNASVIANRENLLILHSDGQNVTLGFSTVEFAIAILNNITLARHAKSKISDSTFQEIAYLLKNSGSNGYHRVISSN